MKIQTKDFGPLDIDEEELIDFPEGVYSFEETKRFVLLEQDDCPALWLQAADGPDPRFIVFRPQEVIEDYAPILPEGALGALCAAHPSELSFYLIAVVPEDLSRMTVNLKSPVVINERKKIGGQFILENREYGVRHRVYGGQAAGGKGGDASC